MKGGTTTSWTTTSVRRSGYKAVVDGVGGRRRREEDMVEIRKAKREESLLKKRREALPLPHSPPPSDAVSLDQNVRIFDWVIQLISRIWSDKKELLIEATTQIRTLLCGEMFNVHVEEVIQAGLVPRFVEFLTWDDFPQLQFEAAWALTNIASGTSENTEVVIDHGAVAILVRLLSSPYDGVREQVVWALGNISGDSPRCRDIVLGHSALPSLLLQLNNGDKLSMLVNAAWTLSNLCRGKPQPPYDQVSAALPALAHLIRLDDKELLAYTCWALVYLSDGSNEKIQAVIEANVCGRLIGLSVHRSPSVATPALRTIGIVVTGNDSQTQESLLKKRREALPLPHSPPPSDAVSLDQNVRVFDWVIQLISRIWSDKKELLIEATTQIRTLLCGEMFNVHVEEVIQAGLVPRFVEFLTWDDFPLLQFEAAWALTNIASGTSENTEVVIDHGAVAILVRLLSSPYDGVREQVVWALGNISGDSPRCRDIVLGHGALPSLLLQLNNGAKLSMLVNAAWTLSNLCRGKPQPPYDQVSAALPALAQLIRLDDKELLAYTCWALVYLSDGSNEKIQAVIEANVCGRLIGLSVHRSPSVATPALRTVGIVVTGNDSQTQVSAALPALAQLIRLDDKELLAYTCWALVYLSDGSNEKIQAVIEANVCGRLIGLSVHRSPSVATPALRTVGIVVTGNDSQTQYIIDLQALPCLLNLLRGPYNKTIRKEACWVVSNITAGCQSQIQAVFDADICPALVNLLRNSEFDVKYEAAWAICNAIAGGSYKQILDIYEMAVKILETYWLEEEEGEEEDKGRQDMVYFPVEKFANMPTPSCTLGLSTDVGFLFRGDHFGLEQSLVLFCRVWEELVKLKPNNFDLIWLSLVLVLLAAWQSHTQLICPYTNRESSHRSPSVATPALRTVGIVVTGNDSQTQYIIDLQALPCLLNLLRGPYNKTIRKEACWVISNITAGCQSQIQAVYDADICPALVNLLRNSEFDVKYEAAWAICNAVAGGSYKQILTKLYVFTPFGLLQSFGYIFLKRVRLIEDAEGLEKIESLQSHENSDIYEMAVKILETYWLEEEEGEDEVEEEDKGRQDIVYFPVDNFANMPTPSCTLGEMYCGP
ncbi:hypothetical protein F2Q68_00018231 [Brassica cretica]|uniref:IBB domain-containing protein n=1 Tax=Brassica cretica TaxID=69181 RepID=A0A8S9HU09_BRACR|nr:hypothetical protein F2Q68_00018231 [Brassica cretica]